MFAILLVLILSRLSLRAQSSNIGSAIRTLDHKEVTAVLRKYTSVFKKIWSPDYTFNSPLNGIQAGGKSTLLGPVARHANEIC